jgi:hypothetical protein
LHREAKKPAVAILRCRCGPKPTPALARRTPGGCRSIAPQSHDRHQGRDGRGPKPKERLHHGDHRHLHQERKRLPSRPSPSTSRPGSPRPRRRTTRLPTTASSPAPPSSERPGRRPPARAAITSPSSSTIRASRLRSTPHRVTRRGVRMSLESVSS